MNICRLLLLMIFLSTAVTVQGNAQPVSPPDQGMTSLTVDFRLKPGYTLFVRTNSGSLYYHSSMYQGYNLLESYELLRTMMDKIENTKQAMAVVQFLTRSPTRFLLKQKPVTAIDITEINGALPWEITMLFSPPVIRRSGDGWVVERDLFMPPAGANNRDKDIPLLIRSNESIKENGAYNISIKSVLLKDRRIMQYLKFR